MSIFFVALGARRCSCIRALYEYNIINYICISIALGTRGELVPPFSFHGNR